MSKKFWPLFFIAFCLIRASLGATQIQGTITLVNDSPFILTATVYTSSGNYLGQIILQPGEQKNYTTNLSSTNLSRPGFPSVSITPYRVVWTCAGGGVYSMCSDGAVGSVVQATACPGEHYCTPKEEQQKTPAGAPGQQKK
jgi:hypothetical protein